MSNGQPPKSKSYFHFVAGLASGSATAVLLQPADLLKTRVQQSRSASLSSAIRDISSGPSPLRQLWRGTLPSTLRTGTGSALYFGSLNLLRRAAATSTLFPSHSNPTTTTVTPSAIPKLSSTANLLTGALARTTAGLILMPLTVLKVRYESNLYAYRSLASAARDILRTEGARGFFAGFGATAVRDAPYAGLYVLFYEDCKRRLGGLVEGRPAASFASAAGGGVYMGADPAAAGRGGLAMGVNFASGVLAAAAATALTNPFDAVKTRIQLMPARYGNTWRAAGVMLREEGVRSFMDGLALRMARKAMSSALAWTVYEELIRRAEVRWAEDGARVL